MVQWKMKTELDKLNDLLSYLIDSPKDDREKVNMLGLYGEYVVNKLLEISSKKNLHKINSQDTKLKILFNMNKIGNTEYDVLDKLRDVRNIYAHNLELSAKDEKEIQSKYLDITINWANQNKIEEQEKISRNYPILRFQVACLVKIKFLMWKIADLEHQQFDRLSPFVLMIDGNKIMI